MVHRPTDQDTSSERQKVIDWLVSHNYPALPVAPAQPGWKYHKVAPAYPEQGIWTYCPLTADLQPIPLYTGKNPSYLNKDGLPQLVNHRQYQTRLPNQQELESWFADALTGVGTLGGWNNTVWLDFDVKQFASQQECDAAAHHILSSPVQPKAPASLQQTFIERSHSGGWRIGVRVKQKPNFTNFSLTQGGAHVGEALFEGRFTVLAPTIGPSGNPYQSLSRTLPVEVESLEAIGIYSTKRGRQKVGDGKHVFNPNSGTLPNTPHTSPPDSQITPTTTPATLSKSSISLEMLGNNTSREILQGGCPTGDRSGAIATAAQEWYGWVNWSHNNGIPISGDVTTLVHRAGSQLGLDTDRINRILQTIDPTSCLPAALYRGGEESCWKKIKRLSPATFERQCPAHLKASMAANFRHGTGHEDTATLPTGNSTQTIPIGCTASPHHLDSTAVETGDGGSGNGDGAGGGGTGVSGSASDNSDSNNHKRSDLVAESFTSNLQGVTTITQTIKDILIQDLPPSELQTAKIQIRKANPYVSPTEIQKLFETLETELELSESRSDRAQEVDNLLKLGDQSLNLNEFLPPDLAASLTQFSAQLNIRPEVCLTLLMVGASSLHKTQTELVIHAASNFSVPPTIFAGLVSESGQKKSPLLKTIIKKPLSVLQREKRVEHARSCAAYDVEITNWDKCKSQERSSKFPEGKPKPPQQQLYYFTNATGEGILYQFQAHPDKALLALVDELVGLFASQNKYTGGRGSDRQDILSAFDGTGATVLRASGTRADIDGLLLSICGTIQPELLKRLMRDCSDPDGQWARFLFVNQPLAAATLSDLNQESVDLQGHLLDYYRAIDRLPALEYKLSSAAFKRYQSVYDKLERLRVSHPNPGMRAVYSKMEGYIGRLALNLHVLHELSLGKSLPDPEIPLFIMERAIALALFYIGQVKLIHANCAADLGDMAPHLARIVELSKRMDATTGSSWIKAKVVQTGYDSRHRPRPDKVRSWFRELEALGIGSTRSAGIRLEYSWKLPDLPIDGLEPPPQTKVEKSGEKWITSPPTETTPSQGFTQKVDKVDNLTHVLELETPISDGITDAEIELCACEGREQGEQTPGMNLGASNQDILNLVASHQGFDNSCCPRINSGASDHVAGEALTLSPPAPSAPSAPPALCGDESDLNLNSPIHTPEFSQDAAPTCPDSKASRESGTQLPEPEQVSISSQNSLEIAHSTYPQSASNDAIAPTEVVDTHSTFSPPVESISTFSPPAPEAPEASPALCGDAGRLMASGEEGEGDGKENPSSPRPNLPAEPVRLTVKPSPRPQGDGATGGFHPHPRVGEALPPFLVEELKSFEEPSLVGNESVVVVMLGASPSFSHQDPLRLTRTGIKTLPLLTLVLSVIERYYLSLVQKATGTEEQGVSQSCQQGDIMPSPELATGAVSEGLYPLDQSHLGAGVKTLFSRRVCVSSYLRVFLIEKLDDLPNLSLTALTQALADLWEVMSPSYGTLRESSRPIHVPVATFVVLTSGLTH